MLSWPCHPLWWGRAPPSDYIIWLQQVLGRQVLTPYERLLLTTILFFARDARGCVIFPPSHLLILSHTFSTLAKFTQVWASVSTVTQIFVCKTPDRNICPKYWKLSDKKSTFFSRSSAFLQPHVVKHDSCCPLLSNKDSYDETSLIIRKSQFFKN